VSVAKLLCADAGDSRQAEMPDHEERLTAGPLKVELCDLPCGAIVLGGVRGRPDIPLVQLETPTLEACQPPSVFVPSFIRSANRAHPFRREVREFLEQVIVNWTPADDTHHSTHPETEVARNI